MPATGLKLTPEQMKSLHVEAKKMMSSCKKKSGTPMRYCDWVGKAYAKLYGDKCKK